MSTRLNSEVGNSSFAEKKTHYANSSFELTKQLGNYEVWNDETISQRQEELAELALITWKI